MHTNGADTSTRILLFKSVVYVLFCFLFESLNDTDHIHTEMDAPHTIMICTDIRTYPQERASEEKKNVVVTKIECSVRKYAKYERKEF